MNRNAHHTLSAVLATTVLVAVVLVSVGPALSGSTGTRFLAPELETTIAFAAALEHAAATEDSTTTSDTSRSTGTETRIHRRTFAMPYFSFAPRG